MKLSIKKFCFVKAPCFWSSTLRSLLEETTLYIYIYIYIYIQKSFKKAANSAQPGKGALIDQ